MAAATNLLATDRAAGFTLVEMMVALFLGVIATAGMYLTYVNYSTAADTQNQTLELQQSLRVSMNRMVKEIRMAGYYNTEAIPADLGIITATANELVFSSDLNADGDIPTRDIDGNILKDGDGEDIYDDNERITFGTRLKNGLLCLYRRDGNKDREYFQEGLDKKAGDHPIDFVYLDKDRQPLTTPVAGGDLQRIKFIQITLVFKSTNQDASYLDSFTYGNLQGDPLISNKNDHYRRQRLSAEVNLRNIPGI